MLLIDPSLALELQKAIRQGLLIDLDYAQDLWKELFADIKDFEDTDDEDDDEEGSSDNEEDEQGEDGANKEEKDKDKEEESFCREIEMLYAVVIQGW